MDFKVAIKPGAAIFVGAAVGFVLHGHDGAARLEADEVAGIPYTFHQRYHDGLVCYPYKFTGEIVKIV